MNLTPLRISVLRFLAGKPNGYSLKGLVHELIPRGQYGWTEQGAARMAGKIAKPLQDAGLIKTDHWAPMYRKDAWITDAGREALRSHEASTSALAAAVESGQ